MFFRIFFLYNGSCHYSHLRMGCWKISSKKFVECSNNNQFSIVFLSIIAQSKNVYLHIFNLDAVL